MCQKFAGLSVPESQDSLSPVRRCGYNGLIISRACAVATDIRIYFDLLPGLTWIGSIEVNVAFTVTSFAVASVVTASGVPMR